MCGMGGCGGCGGGCAGNNAILGGCGATYGTINALAAIACPWQGGWYPTPRPVPNPGIVPPGTPGSGGWSVPIQQAAQDAFSAAVARGGGGFGIGGGGGFNGAADPFAAIRGGMVGGSINVIADAQIDIGAVAQLNRYNAGIGEAVGAAMARVLSGFMG